MKVSAVSGDLVVKVVLAVAAVGAVYYVTTKASDKIGSVIDSVKNAPSAAVDAAQEWYAEQIQPAIESPVGAAWWEAEKGIFQYGPLGATGLPQLAVKGWGLIADAFTPNTGGATGSW